MATFKYISKDMSAKTIRGTLEADDRNDLVRKLKEQNLFLVSCQDVTKKTVNQYKMKLNELSAYSREIGTMLASGLSLIRIFSIMVRREDNKKIKKIYENIYVKLQQGYTLSAAMEAQGVAFPNLMIQMYRSGEASGDMDKTALTMSDQYSKDHRIKGKTKSAMMYPIILIIVTIAVLLIVYLAVLPSFFDIFQNVELPLITKINISISKFLQDYWYFVLLIAAGLVVIFIALLFGHFGVIIPKELGNFGLVLFIFTIGIQAGPGFFDSFRSKGKTLIIITMLIICSASLTAVGLKYLFDIDTPSVVGLIAGALTSTPGLAVAIDSTNSPLASISYGIAYPFGVIGVILFVKLLPRIMRIDLDKEARRLEKERRGQFPELTTCIYRVTNPAVFNRSLMQINARTMTGAVISRHKHDDVISIPTAQTVLHEDDYIQAVGSEEALNQLSVLVGEREEGELPLVDTQEIESLLLTKKDMINKQLGDLNLMKNFGCTITRVRRSGIDLSPSPDLTLKFGDKLMVVGEKEGLKGLARLLGNNAKKLSDTDFFPIAMGIVLGVLFGKLNITFPGGLSFSPGLTGGILIVALFLSAIGKTGPILWSMSGPANQLLRQLGLLLFLAEVGTSAGTNLVATFQESGWLLFGVGAAITLVPMLVAVFVGVFVFKISILDLLGTITGGMTSTPGLAAADSMTDSNIPSVAYATVYPIAMVFLILFIQIIATMV